MVDSNSRPSCFLLTKRNISYIEEAEISFLHKVSGLWELQVKQQDFTAAPCEPAYGRLALHSWRRVGVLDGYESQDCVI